MKLVFFTTEKPEPEMILVGSDLSFEIFRIKNFASVGCFTVCTPYNIVYGCFL